jgi:pimeloyl-ACP methyl ester carboxylesterase
VSPTALTEEQVLDCLGELQAPALVVLADPLPRFLKQHTIEARKAAIPQLESVSVSGGHHVHMDQPEVVAEIVRPFILKHDPNHPGEQVPHS